MRHDFCDGKYTVVNDNGTLSALRYGEPWYRDNLVGDNLVYWMLVEVDRLKAENAELKLALTQFLDPEGQPPEDTGEWREVLRVLAKYPG